MTAEPANAGSTKTDQVRALIEQSIEELASQLESGHSAQFEAYLRALGRFHRYSFGNLLLILSQFPEATRVAGFHTWRSLGRTVKRGEKGIAIFAPMLLKSRDKESSPTAFPSPPPPPELAPESASGTNGNEQNRTTRLRFRIVYVFDVSQTEGTPLPEPTRVGGDPGAFLMRLERGVTTAGITLETVPPHQLGGADGVSVGGRIILREGLSPAERFAVLVHEWAHEILHRVPAEERPDKAIRETEAEAVAFAVCQSIGLETGSAAADYIRHYRGDRRALAASLDRIQKAACTIIDAVSNEQAAGHAVQPSANALVMSAAVAADRRQR